ncbi:alpha/beta fold hydrolase [Ectobacillus sp. sgz5001026]|uniref:alpha/beta fold hydrolase n=1 Tax=Ectobacillus sp. sgz5001026 TaxID=3242473 RepID=UPI0036D3D1AE
MKDSILKDRLPNDPVWQHHYFKSDDVTIHYVRQGTGKPVLLLHGWPGFWYDWRYVIEPLSKDADVIAPDFRGFGESDKPDVNPIDGYTPDHFAKDIISLLDELHVEKVLIVAHDIGATIAQLIAKKYPQYVDSLVLLNPPYNGIGIRRFDPAIQGQFWYQHFHNLHWAGDLIGYNEDTVRLYLTHFYQTWTGKKEALRPKELDAIIQSYAKDEGMKRSINYYKARAQAKTQAVVQKQAGIEEKIPHTTHVLWGEADPVILVDWSDKLYDYFDEYTLKRLPGIGHFVSFEAPEEVVETVKKARNKAIDR